MNFFFSSLFFIFITFHLFLNVHRNLNLIHVFFKPFITNNFENSLKFISVCKVLKTFIMLMDESINIKICFWFFLIKFTQHLIIRFFIKYIASWIWWSEIYYWLKHYMKNILFLSFNSKSDIFIFFMRDLINKSYKCHFQNIIMFF